MPRQLPWTEKYRPKHVNEVVGNPEAKRQFVAWLNKWVQYLEDIKRCAAGKIARETFVKKWKDFKKAAMLVGPPGVGKTTLVYAAANDYGFEVMELNASDVRSKSMLEKLLKPAIGVGSLFGLRGRIILLDEVDGLHARADAGGLEAILSIFRDDEAAFASRKLCKTVRPVITTPIVMTANNPWDPKFRELRNRCEIIKFEPIPEDEGVKALARICRSEGIECEEEALREILRRVNGDLRAAINDLQAIAEGKRRLTLEDVRALGTRNAQLDMMKILDMVFEARYFDQARSVTMNPSFDYEMYFEYLNENLPRRFAWSIDALAEAYDNLSKADVIMGRIKREQEWSLLPYALELATAGIALVPKKPPRRAMRYDFPQKILLLSRMKEFRRKRDVVLKALAEELHMSTGRVITEIIPYLRIIAEKRPGVLESIARKIGRTAKEVLKVLIEASY